MTIDEAVKIYQEQAEKFEAYKYYLSIDDIENARKALKSAVDLSSDEVMVHFDTFLDDLSDVTLSSECMGVAFDYLRLLRDIDNTMHTRKAIYKCRHDIEGNPIEVQPSTQTMFPRADVSNVIDDIENAE